MIKPMTPEMAITTARQVYMMLYGLDVSERMFAEMVAPEIYGAARMENLAAQQTVRAWCGELQEWCDKGIAKLSSRYEGIAKSRQQTGAQPGLPQIPEQRVVLATEADIQALL
jgi:hypothetical protein